MSNFVLKLKKDDFSSVSKEITFNGVSLMLEYKKNPYAERALSVINRELSSTKLLTREELTKRSEMTEQEGILFVVGEYVISKWNITDDKGNALEINGEHFLQLCEQISEDMSEKVAFVSLVLSTFNDLSREYYQKREEVKKKP